MDGVVLGRAQGVANLIGGLWPLLHISSFEMVFGPKTDRWLVKTVAGLLMVNGLTQLTTSSTAGGVRQARRCSCGARAFAAERSLGDVAPRPRCHGKSCWARNIRETATLGAHSMINGGGSVRVWSTLW
jgi:hypothetical protein